MAKARIYQPDKNAMQSGKAKNAWLLQFTPQKPYFVDNLMGWVGMEDMPQEVKLVFPTKEAAVEYATRQKIEFQVFEPHKRVQVKKAYADNFKFNKLSD